jgi:hypothetical protein
MNGAVNTPAPWYVTPEMCVDWACVTNGHISQYAEPPLRCPVPSCGCREFVRADPKVAQAYRSRVLMERQQRKSSDRERSYER